MATLCSDIINQAFVDLGIIRPGETISGLLQTDAFAALQQSWASMSNDQTFTYAWYHQQFAMVAGTSAYTVGTGGTLVATADPIRITAWRSVSGNFANSGQCIPFEQFEANVKDPLSTTSVLAQVVAADGSIPNKNIRVFPVPAAGPGALILDYFGKMTQFAAVSDALAFGPGYEQFIRKDLAITMYPAYARSGALTLQALTASRDAALNIIRQNNAAIQQLGAQAPPAQAA